MFAVSNIETQIEIMVEQASCVGGGGGGLRGGRGETGAYGLVGGGWGVDLERKRVLKIAPGALRGR